MIIEFMIMICRLSGVPPFWDRIQLVMLRQIMEANYRMGPEWDDISAPAKDLVLFFIFDSALPCVGLSRFPSTYLRKFSLCAS